MTEPTAEHLKVAQLDLNRANLFLNHSRAKHSDYCWQCDQPWPCDSMAAIIDADHEWAQWFEKWKAALDLVASFASREQALRMAIDRIREHWPHIEVGIKGRTHDPGSPTCLRCTIEKEIADAGAV